VFAGGSSKGGFANGRQRARGPLLTERNEGGSGCPDGIPKVREHAIDLVDQVGHVFRALLDLLPSSGMVGLDRLVLGDSPPGDPEGRLDLTQVESRAPQLMPSAGPPTALMRKRGGEPDCSDPGRWTTTMALLPNHVKEVSVGAPSWLAKTIPGWQFAWTGMTRHRGYDSRGASRCSWS
jgi:hypothetical protein